MHGTLDSSEKPASVGTSRSLVAIVLFFVLTLGISYGADDLRAPQRDESPSGRSSPTPIPYFSYDRKAVFTMALGTDTATASKITNALADRLIALSGKLQHASAPRSDGHYWFVPQGDWTIADYQNQCAKDPAHTLGAYIVLPPSRSDHTENSLVFIRTRTTVRFSLVVAVCHPAGDQTDATSSVTWVSESASGEAMRSEIEIFPLALLTSLYLAFSPQRTYQTVTTQAFPTPNPLPAEGARASTQTTASSVLNPSGSATLQGGILGAFAGSGIGSTTGATGSPDLQFAKAADDAVGKLLEPIKARCAPYVGTAAAPPDGYAFCTWFAAPAR